MRLLPTTFAPALGAMIVGCTLCTLPHGGGPASDATAVTPMAPQRPDEAAAGPVGEEVAEIDKSCWVVFQDRKGNHWFGSDGQGVFRFDGRIITRFTTKDGLSHDQIRGIQEHLPTGHILISTNGGVTRYDGRSFTTLPIKAMQAAAPPHEGWVLAPGDLWLPGAGGPRRYDGTTLLQLKFPPSPLEAELTMRIPHRDDWSPYDVWHVYTDRTEGPAGGAVWFGTGMFGVCRFDGSTLDWMFESHLTEVPGGGWFGFRSIIQDRSGAFWVCSTQYRFEMMPHGAAGQQEGLIQYRRRSGMDLSAVATTDRSFHFQSVAEDDNGHLWMAPYAGGVWRYDGASVTHHPMKDGDQEITMVSIFKDRRGDIWVGTHEHGAYRFNGTSFVRFRPG